jgi:hypothetical protein
MLLKMRSFVRCLMSSSAHDHRPAYELRRTERSRVSSPRRHSRRLYQWKSSSSCGLMPPIASPRERLPLRDVSAAPKIFFYAPRSVGVSRARLTSMVGRIPCSLAWPLLTGRPAPWESPAHAGRQTSSRKSQREISARGLNDGNKDASEGNGDAHPCELDPRMSPSSCSLRRRFVTVPSSAPAFPLARWEFARAGELGELQPPERLTFQPAHRTRPRYAQETMGGEKRRSIQAAVLDVGCCVTQGASGGANERESDHWQKRRRTSIHQ